MKQIIVLSAVLPLLLVFAMNFSAQARTATIRADTAEIVTEYASYARQEGGFATLKTGLKESLAARLGVESDTILVMEYTEDSPIGWGDFEGAVLYLDNGPLYKGATYDTGEYIRYRVELKIRDTVAGAGYFGISDPTSKYVIEGQVLSERLK